MAEKKRPTDEELLAQFDALGDSQPAAPAAGPKTGAPAAAAAGGPKADPLAELENLAQERPKSRPHTPRVGGLDNKQASPKKASDAAIRKSTDSARSFRQAQTPTDESNKEARGAQAAAASPTATAGGGWWGTISGLANAATRQAEALAKEIQKNEEAQRWAEQVRGNVGALRSYGDELRSKALPTFTNLLHTLAPPISSHERLQIHIAHDLVGYPSLEPLVYQTFSRVMAQVEGGDLLVAQRGQEATQRRGSDGGYRGGSTSGWGDGPWWRNAAEKRDSGTVDGLVAATKLARASAESYASEFFAARGGPEEAARQAADAPSESNPTRRSDIFLALQAATHEQSPELFAEPPARTEDAAKGVADPEARPERLVSFAVYLHDPVHGIAFSAVSQSLPQPWIGWLDNLAAVPDAPDHMPDAVRDVVEAGGLDPREWVAEWLEETLALAAGTVAQRYVARRMGVGEGGPGKGKAKESEAAGEAAKV